MNECLQPALAYPPRREMLILPYVPLDVTRLLQLIEQMGWPMEGTQKGAAVQFTSCFEDGPKTWAIARLDDGGVIRRSLAPGQWQN